jgi:hypothetical protein
LAGEPSPVYRGHEIYILPLERLIEGMRRQDPIPRSQLAVPVAVTKAAHAIAYKMDCPKKRVTADLIIIAYIISYV